MNPDVSGMKLDSSHSEQARPIEELRAYSAGRPGKPSHAIAWSSDNRYIAYTNASRKVTIYPWNKYANCLAEKCSKGIEGQHHSTRAVTIDTGGYVYSLAFALKSRQHPRTTHSVQDEADSNLMLATGVENGRIRTWNIKTGLLEMELCDHEGIVRDLAFSPSGPLHLVSASQDGSLKVWDMDDGGNMRKTLISNCSDISGCCWAPDSKILASVGNYKSVHLWDMVSYKLIRRLEGHINDVCKCEFSPDGTLLATSSYDTRVIVWDIRSVTALLLLEHTSPLISRIYAGGANGSYVQSTSFSHDGKHIASVCDDGFVRVWDIFDPCQPAQVASPTGANCCRFSSDGTVLAVGTVSGTVKIYLSPVELTSLQRLCRLAIRRILPLNKVESLDIVPPSIQRFLRFDLPHLRDTRLA